MAVSKSKRPTIVVTGDVTMDWNIARIRRNNHPANSAWNAEDVSRAFRLRGGAALLGDLIQAVARKKASPGKIGFRIVHTPILTKAILPSDDRFHQSYSIWAPFPCSEKFPKRKVWRVEEFLGLGSRKASRSNRLDTLKYDPASARLVVLDDADRGFRDDSARWPRAIKTGTPWVILKISRPLIKGKLWNHLVKHHADRLIAVMAIGDLRLDAVQISRGLSWERTAQDICRELLRNPQVNGLARCAKVVISFNTAGALVISRSVSPKEETPVKSEEVGPLHASLHFDPAVMEGMWNQDYPGKLIGYTSCLTAAIATQIMFPSGSPSGEFDVDEGVRRGLAAMRRLHCRGYGRATDLDSGDGPSFPLTSIAEVLASTDEAQLKEFVVADVQHPIDSVIGGSASGGVSDDSEFWTILDDRYPSGLTSIAESIVFDGPKKALKSVPLGKFGKLLTVDRREIESFQSIGTLVREYAEIRWPERPLNIAVFGTPGSGKSFGVGQLAESLLGENKLKKLTFNLSQFSGPEQVHDALHQVRDVGLTGKMPLVFWDEFDGPLNKQSLGWLAHFLAPMQDGSFQHGQITHSIGPAIFVFAGGTKESLMEFDRGPADAEFKNVKGPDFVSRLKGYVDIVGPNPRADMPGGDLHHKIRRAILLRTFLEKAAPQIFDSEEKMGIDRGILRAFLGIKKYKHGARSMESVIAMSELAGSSQYNRSCLPAIPQLNLHVDAAEFQWLMQQIVPEGAELETLAKKAHEVFCKGLRARGYSYGIEKNEQAKTHPMLVEYSELREIEKEQNRENVRDIPRKLESAGYTITRRLPGERLFTFPQEVVERLAEAEHDRWIKTEIAAGFRWGKKTDIHHKLHNALVPWRNLTAKEWSDRFTPTEAAALGKGLLPEHEKKKDRELVKGIPVILAKVKYTIELLRKPNKT